MQQYADIYLLQTCSTCFGCLTHPLSGVQQNVIAASGTGHSVRATTFRQRGLISRSKHVSSYTINNNKNSRFWWISYLKFCLSLSRRDVLHQIQNYLQERHFDSYLKAHQYVVLSNIHKNEFDGEHHDVI